MKLYFYYNISNITIKQLDLQFIILRLGKNDQGSLRNSIFLITYSLKL